MNIIKQLHTKYGISYSKIAEELNLSASFVSRIANGDRGFPQNRDKELDEYLKKLKIDFSSIGK